MRALTSVSEIHVIDQEISIGDYVLTNGTLAAAVVIDALARFIPGVLGEEKSLTHESFTSKLLDFPQYTRPAEFRGMSIPEVLLSGNHAEIEKWRLARQMEKTRQGQTRFTQLTHVMNPIIQEITAAQVKKDITPFKVGDGVRVHTEGARRRQGTRAGLRRHRDRAQGRGHPRDLHGPPPQLRRGRSSACSQSIRRTSRRSRSSASPRP
jgi:hypothetical protein